MRTTVLPNGLRVLSERMRSVRSVSLGVWLTSGSRHEDAADSGITHFVEHMVFKGTERFTAREIAYTMDGLGGLLDAFTAKETTAFTAKVLDQHWSKALEVLAEMVQNPIFADDDIEREKGVVLEELKMEEDNPEYLLGRNFAHGFWSDHGMGRPIIGNEDSIRAFNRSRLQGFFGDTFRAPNLLVTAAGNVDHDELIREVERRFGSLNGQNARRPQPVAVATPVIVLCDKASLEQVHLALGIETFRARDPRRFAGFVLSTILGGGCSSRLFQKIREERGLAYSVFSDLSLYSDTGCLWIGAGVALDALPRVVQCVMREFRDLKENLVADSEIRRAKDHLKGSRMLSLESTGSRMANLARQESYYGEIRSMDEINESIESVTAASVRELADEWFQPDKIALAAVGCLGDLRIGRDHLAC